MLNVNHILITENIKQNASSNIKIKCKANKTIFTRQIKSQSLQPMFIDKVDFDSFTIHLEFICLKEGLVQSVDEDGYAVMKGDFFHRNDGSLTYLNLSTEISHSNWIKLKSDLLLLKRETLSFYVLNIVINEIVKDDNFGWMESKKIEAVFESYAIFIH